MQCWIWQVLKDFKESCWFGPWFRTMVGPPCSHLTLRIPLWEINVLVLPAYDSLSWTTCIWYSIAYLAPFWPLETFSAPSHPSRSLESLDLYSPKLLKVQLFSRCELFDQLKHNLRVWEGLTSIGQARSGHISLKGGKRFRAHYTEIRNND